MEIVQWRYAHVVHVFISRYLCMFLYT